MFKSELQQWFDQQPKHTQEWMKKQAIWRDSDMVLALAIGFAIGFCIGYII